VVLGSCFLGLAFRIKRLLGSFASFRADRISVAGVWRGTERI
jgi:hypothetical protein